jgi:hypothetical protein
LVTQSKKLSQSAAAPIPQHGTTHLTRSGNSKSLHIAVRTQNKRGEEWSAESLSAFIDRAKLRTRKQALRPFDCFHYDLEPVHVSSNTITLIVMWSQSFTTFSAATLQNQPTCFSAHTLTETMRFRTTPIVRLKSSFCHSNSSK